MLALSGAGAGNGFNEILIISLPDDSTKFTKRKI
jgi:hypothetical protein